MMATQKDLATELQKALSYNGFAVVDIWGFCPGRFLKRNQWTIKQMRETSAALPGAGGTILRNERAEYGRHYFEQAKAQSASPPLPTVDVRFEPILSGRCEVLLLGAAGQRINTAGEILCLAALSSGLHATQKNDYPITVLRGHSISEVVLSSRPIDYTGLHAPGIVVALSSQGVARRERVFASLDAGACVIKAKGVGIPSTAARVVSVDFKTRSVRSADRALAALAVLAHMGRIITPDMLQSALEARFEEKQRDQATALITRGDWAV
jgi:Pyruvate/2-oxoacid:ferredoxin oxidoreductase gamma subunit